MKKKLKNGQKKKRETKKKLWLKRAGKINAALLLIFFALYLSVGFTIDSSFFTRDAREKIGRVAGASTETTLRTRLIALPTKPILTAAPFCNNGSSFVRLDWSEAESTDYYNVDRDSLPLVSGITDTTYADSTQGLTTYSYVVTAVGPLGQASSDPVSVTTDDCTIIPEPTCVITKLDEINLIGFSGAPTIHNRLPILYGTTNMALATIDIQLLGSTPIIAQVQANINGYWSWQSPIPLAYGPYLATVTATDPVKITRQKTATLNFEIKKKESEEEKEKKKKKETSPAVVLPVTPVTPPPLQTTLSLSITTLNQDKALLAGQTLDLRTEIKTSENFEPGEKELTYKILSPRNEVILETSDKITVAGDMAILKDIKLPKLLESGTYRISVETRHNDAIINAEDWFLIKERPLISIGQTEITLTEILRTSSWLSLILLILLVFLIILISLEHWVSKHALSHITEENLKKGGFIKRKGVSRE